MFRRVYGRIDGRVAENDQFIVNIYKHPDESGQEKWHVHFVRRSDGADAKIGIWNFELMRKTTFDRKTVKNFVEWTYENRHYLRRKWLQNVLRPFMKSLGKWRERDEK